MQIYQEEIDPCTDESKYPLLSKYFDIDYTPGNYIWSKTNEFKEAVNYIGTLTDTKIASNKQESISLFNTRFSERVIFPKYSKIIFDK